MHNYGDTWTGLHNPCVTTTCTNEALETPGGNVYSPGSWFPLPIFSNDPNEHCLKLENGVDGHALRETECNIDMHNVVCQFNCNAGE